MPALTASALRKQIESGSVAPVYLLQGEDEVEKAALAGEFEALVEEGLRAFNVERIHAADVSNADKVAETIGSLLDAARTLPMMAPRRVVAVFHAENLLAPKRESQAAERALDQLGAFLEQPEPLTTVVLISGPLDKRTKIYRLLTRTAVVVDCGAPEDVAAAARWIQVRVEQSGTRIEPQAARAMAAAAGFPDRPSRDGRTGDVKRLRNEVDRLLLYALGQKTITIDDVRAVAGPAALQDEWAMANAIEAGNAAEALRQLALLFDAGSRAEMILGQLGWLVRSKFPAAAPGSLTAAVESLFRTDLALKRSAGDPRVLLERLVVELCAGKRAAAPRRW
jgi:DNA polymerase III delta subunit